MPNEGAARKGRWFMAEVIRDGAVVADTWQVLRLAEGETPEHAAVPAEAVIVPLDVWRARRAELESRAHLGVWLKSSEGPELIAADLERFRVIAVDFPKFTDGRGYSTATLLRTRYGWRGELRAIGDVLRDQLFFLRRCGFDSFALRPDQEPYAALASWIPFSDPYQGAVDVPQPLWRRHARR